MAFLQNKLARKTLISLILAWGMSVVYFLNKDNYLFLSFMFLFSLWGIYYIWKEKSAIFLLILLSFTSTYAFLIFLLQYNLPVWLAMVGVLIVFSFLFFYTEQRIGILGNKRLIYLVLFSLIILEVFLALTYFLIDPISQSLIIAVMSYLFIGFCYTVIAKHTDNKFLTYVIFASVAILVILITSSWGGFV